MPAKNQTPTTPTLSPARKLLKETLEAQGRARVLEAKARAVVDAASTAVEQARAEAAAYAEIDEDAVKARLAALKGEPGAKSPEEIAEARRKRLLAKEELLAADLTLQVAQQELDEARGNVARAQKMCASHATGVLSECATDAIAAWQKLNEEREALRTILSALIMVALPTRDPFAQQRSSPLRGSRVSCGATVRRCT